ncbi:MAG TPA: hypothetical protein VEG39_13940 [Clostridia bacterium]|nr:hypothetical protein [Clostridia bacterium]
MDKLFTWEAIATLTGAATLVYFIVAYTKRPLDKLLPKLMGAIGTDLYAVFWAFIVLLVATTVITGGLTWASVALALFNAFIVAAAAGKMNDKAVYEAKQSERDTK